jgi:hypothetical protein
MRDIAPMMNVRRKSIGYFWNGWKQWTVNSKQFVGCVSGA